MPCNIDGQSRADAEVGPLGFWDETMRQALIAAVLAAAAMGGASSAATPLDNGVYSPRTDAPALIQTRLSHTCVARSATAMGYWTARYLATAKLGALRQCAVRTPAGLVCLIVSCS